MFDLKRFIISLTFGLIAGIICYIGAVLLNISADALHMINILVNRTLIGFVIGISAFKMKWYLHGLLMGEVIGLPFFFFDLITGVEISIVFVYMFFFSFLCFEYITLFYI